MVIKERYKRVKSPHCPQGFMLLEAVALVGFVVLIGSGATMLHGLIMRSYRETDNRMHALLYAENTLASVLTGVPYALPTTASQDFNSTLVKTKSVAFLPTQRPCTLVTVTVVWHEKGIEKKSALTRLMADDKVRA